MLAGEIIKRYYKFDSWDELKAFLMGGREAKIIINGKVMDLGLTLTGVLTASREDDGDFIRLDQNKLNFNSILGYEEFTSNVLISTLKLYELA